jgi:hypothetical protein
MRSIRYISAILLSVLLCGCAGYQLKGVVVEGRVPGVYVVDSGDARLKQTAVADARVQATLDPQKLRSKQLPMTLTDDNGRFSIGVDDPGAGLLEYSMSLYCDAEGYGDAGVDTMPLPGAGKQLLVVLSAGRRKGPPRSTEPKENLLDEADKIKKQYGIE